jgi:hypothetical protein
MFLILGYFCSFFFFFFKSGFYIVAHTGLELMILLPQFADCWDYKFELPFWTGVPDFDILFNAIYL